MDRREFLKVGALTTAAIVVLPTLPSLPPAATAATEPLAPSLTGKTFEIMLDKEYWVPFPRDILMINHQNVALALVETVNKDAGTAVIRPIVKDMSILDDLVIEPDIEFRHFANATFESEGRPETKVIHNL